MQTGMRSLPVIDILVDSDLAAFDPGRAEVLMLVCISVSLSASFEPEKRLCILNSLFAHSRNPRHRRSRRLRASPRSDRGRCRPHAFHESALLAATGGMEKRLCDGDAPFADDRHLGPQRSRRLRAHFQGQHVRTPYAHRSKQKSTLADRPEPQASFRRILRKLVRHSRYLASGPCGQAVQPVDRSLEPTAADSRNRSSFVVTRDLSVRSSGIGAQPGGGLGVKRLTAFARSLCRLRCPPLSKSQTILQSDLRVRP